MKKLLERCMTTGKAWTGTTLGIFLSLVTPPILYAANGSFGATSAPTIVLGPSSVQSSLCNILTWLFFFLMALASIMIVVAAYTYLTSNGDPEKVSKATKTILYAAIGIVVALLAKGFPALIGSLFGVSTPIGC